MEAVSAYHETGLALAASGILLFVQLLVADIAGIKARHTPGAPIEASHGSFHFRANRSLANMNESIAIFLVFALTGILGGANAYWLGVFSWCYIGTRTAYMFCYWYNIKWARSLVFVLSLLALLGVGGVMVGGLI